jgi:hypothetical protein
MGAILQTHIVNRWEDRNTACFLPSLIGASEVAPFGFRAGLKLDLIGLEPYDRPDGRGKEEAKRSSRNPSSAHQSGALATPVSIA